MSTALITGASTGIGRATALRLDRAGWTVWAGIRDHDDGTLLSDEASGRLRPLELDVTDEGSIEAARAGIERAGGIDAVVNNAGVGIAGPLELLTPDELRRQLDVNVVGQVAVTRAVLGLLRAAEDPRIVFVGSITRLATGSPSSASVPEPSATATASSASPSASRAPIAAAASPTRLRRRSRRRSRQILRRRAIRSARARSWSAR